jgi:hypothetical protein
MKFIFSLIILFTSVHATVFPTKLRELKPNFSTLLSDTHLIIQESKLPITIQINLQESEHTNTGKITCSENHISINVKAKKPEQFSTYYYGLQKLGFLFPHPRLQISPKLSELKEKCGMEYEWRAAFKFRGFHLHTMHPNEWVHGFLMGETKMATDTIRWLARNGQNVVDLNLLKMKRRDIFERFKAPFQLAKEFGIHTGVQLGFAQNQQNSYKLLGILRTIFGFRTDQKLRSNLKKILSGLDLSFIAMVAGTSEFTNTDYEDTIRWFEVAADVCEELNVQIFTSVHVSTNQNHPKYGNFNFLPQYTSERVGIWPHTVMFYGLYDEEVPMYGNKDFSHMLNFMNQEKSKRPTWYFPETSYWIAMDIDAPLLLTDYLKARSVDMKNIYEEGVEGHINFTTGHEMGYWLFDWNLTLQNNLDYQFKEDIALELLGEDLNAWQEIMKYQSEFFKEKQLIQLLSFPNLQDEIAPKHKIHERYTFKELRKDYQRLHEELELLKEAMLKMPSPMLIKNSELKALMEITLLRIEHAYATRMALKNRNKITIKQRYLKDARDIRLSALKRMALIMNEHDRYPESFTFKRRHNPTAYEHGYAWPASTLHFWETEEQRVKYDRFGPFFRNIYNFIDIIF